jgi:hypothetical protein
VKIILPILTGAAVVLSNELRKMKDEERTPRCPATARGKAMPAEAQAPGLPDPVGRSGEEPLYHFTRIYLLFLPGPVQAVPEGQLPVVATTRHLTEIVITDQVPIPGRDRAASSHRHDERPGSVRQPLSIRCGRWIARTGMKERTDLIGCTMTLNCIAKMGPEAQRIAWIVMRHVRDFRVMLQRAGFHQIGDNISMGPESPPGAIIAGEGDPEAVMVTVFSPFHFQWTEQVTPLYAPVAKNIEAHIKAGIPQWTMPKTSTTFVRSSVGQRFEVVQSLPRIPIASFQSNRRSRPRRSQWPNYHALALKSYRSFSRHLRQS